MSRNKRTRQSYVESSDDDEANENDRDSHEYRLKRQRNNVSSTVIE